MKKLTIIIAALLLTIATSCEVEPDCGCGVVQSGNQFNLPGSSFGTYRIKNNCTGEIISYSYNGTPPSPGTIICN